MIKLKAQQIQLCALIAVIVHNLGRCFGVLWNPVYFYLFPTEQYGFVFGSVSLLSQPFTLLNIIMLNYNTENNDYALMNYILGGVIMLVLLVSFSCYRKWTSENYNKGRVPLYDRLSFIYINLEKFSGRTLKRLYLRKKLRKSY